jgi:hypothetical protein
VSESLLGAGEQIARALGHFLASGDVQAAAVKFATVAADWQAAADAQIIALQKGKVAMQRTNELVQIVKEGLT